MKNIKDVKNAIKAHKNQIIGIAAATIVGGIALYCLDHSEIGYNITDRFITKLAEHQVSAHKLRFYQIMQCNSSVSPETMHEIIAATNEILKKAGIVKK